MARKRFAVIRNTDGCQSNLNVSIHCDDLISAHTYTEEFVQGALQPTFKPESKSSPNFSTQFLSVFIGIIYNIGVYNIDFPTKKV